jgi:putative tryptophan/tyrosine transport system substrate-binding protein
MSIASSKLPSLATLPSQMPTKYTLIISMKTAKAPDLNVPSGLLAAADDVIE